MDYAVGIIQLPVASPRFLTYNLYERVRSFYHAGDHGPKSEWVRSPPARLFRMAIN